MQVLSESVACAMELRNLPDTTSTVIFIRHMNRFFDCLNVSNLYQGNKGNKFKEPYRSMDDERFKVILLLIFKPIVQLNIDTWVQRHMLRVNILLKDSTDLLSGPKGQIY